MNTLQQMFVSLASSLGITARETLQKSISGRGGPRERPFQKGHSHLGLPKSGKTRRGATHKIGSSFKPRKHMAMTPAQYRRNHRGNPAKFVYEKMRRDTRKWISA